MKKLRELLEWTASADRIYHFTSGQTALEHVLGNERLRFNSLKNTNDPREFENFAIVVTADGEHDDEEFDLLTSVAPRLASNVKDVCKLACFTQDMDSSKSDYNNIFDKGYCLPRMWSQYGDNHSGVCLVFSQRQLLKNIETDTSAFHLPKDTLFRVFANPVKYDNDSQKLFDALTLKYEQDRGKSEDQLLEERVDTLLFNKYLNYAHEQEFRIVLFSKFFESSETIDVKFGDALDAIILGVRFRKVFEPSVRELAIRLKVPVLRMSWYNGVPDLEAVLEV